MGAPLGPIQLIPPGLTGLLALKQLGRLPDELLGQVQPSIDLRDWYFQSRREKTLSLFGAALISAAIVTGNKGFFPLLINGAAGAFSIVPAGQTWYVEEYGITATNAVAADTISFTLGIASTTPAGGEFQTLSQPFQDVVTGNLRGMSQTALRGFWMVPGDQFGVWILNCTSAGGIALSGTVLATRLPT